MVIKIFVIRSVAHTLLIPSYYTRKLTGMALVFFLKHLNCVVVVSNFLLHLSLHLYRWEILELF